MPSRKDRKKASKTKQFLFIKIFLNLLVKFIYKNFTKNYLFSILILLNAQKEIIHTKSKRKVHNK